MGVSEVSSWIQLKILLKKNIWLKKRGYIGTICEFLFPAAIIMLGCVYALLFTMFNEVHWSDTSVDSLTTWNNTDPYNDCMDYYDQDPNKCFLGIVPNPQTTNDTRLEFILQGMQDYFYNTTYQNVTFMFFDSDSDMKSYYEDDDNKLSLWSGVVFTFQGNSLNYTIRVNNSYIPFTISNSFSQSFGFGSLWDSNGFLTVQTAVETSFIQYQAVESSLPFDGLFNFIEKFPFDFASSVGGAFPLIISGFLMYAFIPLMLNSMVALFRERNEKVKETMKMMGMSESMYWVSWYITVAVPAIWICLAMIILGKACYLFTHSNLFIVFIFAFLFGLSVISFTFLMSIWVKGTLVAAVVTFGWLFLMMNAVTFVVNFSAGAQAVLSLISPIAFCLGMVQIIDLDLFKDGIQFSNINNNDFSVTDAMIMMIVDTIIYSVLNWYFANIFPGEYGIAKSALFPFQKSYWFPVEPASEEEKLMNPISDVKLQGQDNLQSDNPFIEPVSPDLALKCGVSIRNLRKVYGDSSDPDNCTIAVKNLSVDLYYGEIFGFLGMNGAGKTTTISMLTGLYPPTAGDAFIDGLSIRTSTDLIRKRIGICPQDNILFERLTAREHLTLFGILKGIPQDQINSKVEEMLQLIGLGDKADKISKTYSGGMKRKLQIGIALMGDSKVVIFDEPTAGMDSVSRRQFWNTLRGMKENRVIILVSHMMEECDVLSDRIGIMKTGDMVCYGTSTFLKNKLGSGDYLNIVGEESIEKKDVLKFVQKHIPKSKIVSETPTDLSILLPLGTRDKFPDLLGDLEQLLAGKKNELNIKGFGISMTSLEDVFLRITQDDFVPNNNVASAHNSSSNLSSINNGSNNNFSSSNDIKVKIKTPRGSMKQGLLTGNYPAPTWTSHFKLLLQMKLLSARRNWKTTLSLLLVPAIFMIVVVGSGKISNLTIDEGSSKLTQLTFTDFYPLIVPYYQEEGVNATYLIEPLQYIQPDTTQLSFVEKDTLSSFQDFFFDDDSSDRSEHRFGGIQYTTADYLTNLFNYTLVYNTSELNSLPAFTNMMSNAVLKYLMNDTTAEFLISSYSHPFPGSGLNIDFGNDMMMITFSFLVGFSITMGLLTRTIVYEKQKKIQFQYSILGVNSGVYWITHYLFDYALNVLSFLFLSLVLLAFDVKEYMHIDYLALFIFTLWFLIALVASNYALSFLFQDAEDCLKYLFIFNLMLGVAPFIAILVFQLAVKTDSMDWLKYLFPMSTYASGLGSIQTVHSIFDITGETKKLSDFFEWDQLGEKMFFLAIHAVVSIGAIIFVDRFGNKIRPPRSAEIVPPPPNEDEDVAVERQRLANLDQCEDLIQVKDVMKDYGHFKAVKNITLGIKENECFGLLGPNGAGKTTTISMLTREIEPTSGDVRLCGKSVWSMPKDEHYKIAKPGCCLQFDSLNDYLTGREHLRLYCKLRNQMPPDQVEDVVEEYLEKLNIVVHGNKITKNYSGGTKRKLSVALALMTGNQILYLDEPSTGMDPSARRALWTAIETERKKPGRAIVLTTHALEEAEAVSQRIGIVVRGQLQCLGSTQHLKSKFEDKYFLFINSKEATMDHIDRFVQETFPGSVLLESYGGSGIKYDIGRLDSVAYAFRSMEQNKDKLGITEYSITQTTLEHIFLFFAKRQEEATSGITAWTDIPQHHQCQFCEANMVTETTYKVGKGSWLAGVLLSLVCCCCLGCMVSSFKDVQHSCPNCHKIVGIHKKL